MKYFFLLSLVFLTNCSSTSGKEKQLIFRQDVLVSAEGQAPKAVKKGEVFTTTASQVVVDSPGYMSLLLVNNENSKRLEVELVPVEIGGGVNFKLAIGKIMEKTMPGIIRSYQLMSERKFELALVELNNIQTSYPEMTYLYFIKASCLVALSRQGEAISALETGLRFYPNEESANLLLKKLKGGQ